MESSTVGNTLIAKTHIGATGAKTPCCKNAATSYCDSWPKTWGESSTTYWIRSSGRLRISKETECLGREPVGLHADHVVIFAAVLAARK